MLFVKALCVCSPFALCILLHAEARVVQSLQVEAQLICFIAPVSEGKLSICIGSL